MIDPVEIYHENDNSKWDKKYWVPSPRLKASRVFYAVKNWNGQYSLLEFQVLAEAMTRSK